MTGWTDWLRTCDAPAAIVTILATEGSAPRGPGTRMLVTAAALTGTIGGGQLEYRAVAQARAILMEPPGSWRVQDYPLGPLLGQCCGGRVRLLVEHVEARALGWLDEARDGAVLVTRLTPSGADRRIDADALPAPLPARGERPGAGAVLIERIGAWRRPLYLFGGGHVGQAIARHAAALPFRLAWFDTRENLADVAGLTIVAEDRVTDCLGDAPRDAAVVILTHDHALDYRLTAAALRGAPLAFVGLIGSATKRARFLARLAREAVDADAHARLTCPIGIEGVAGKEPDVIAVATLAQLLQLGEA